MTEPAWKPIEADATLSPTKQCSFCGCRARAIELDPVYVDVALRRWQAATGGEAVLADNGRTFNEIERERR